MEVLDLLLLSGEFIENKEGTVITFANGKMAKQKNHQYMTLHGLLSDGLKENKLIDKILNEEIDDVISFLPVDAVEERAFIDELTLVIVNHVNHLATYSFDTFNEHYKGDRKEFVMQFRQDPCFHYMAKLFNENTFENVEKMVIENVLRNTRRLEMARTYVRDLGFNRELKLIEDDN